MKAQVITTFKKLLRHELITGSFYVFSAGIVVGILNFLFNIFLTRRLSYSDYGIYAAIISLIAILSIPAQAMTQVIIRFATEYISKKELGKAKRFYKQASVTLVSLGIILAIFLMVFSSVVSSFFQLHSIWYLLLAGILLILGYGTLVTNAYVQSLLRFRLLSVINVINSVSRIAIGGLLVIFGFQVSGALGGTILAGIIAFVAVFLPVIKVFGGVKEVGVNSHFRHIGKYSILAGVSMLALASFTSSDILLVKHFFSPTTAGLYAGLAIVGKVIFYFSAPITAVMFPLVIHRHHQGKGTRNILYLSIFLVFLPSLLLSVLYTIFPTIFLTFFLGGRGFLQMSQYVGLYGVYIALFSIINIFVTYSLSMHYAPALYLAGVAAVAQIVGIVIFHSSLGEVINVSVGVLLLLSIGMSYMLLKHIKK